MQGCDTKNILTRLSQITDQSEVHFLALATGFPELRSELVANIQSASRQLAQFTNDGSGDRSSGGNDILGAVWSEAQRVFTHALDHFSRLSRNDAEVFQALNDSIDRLARLNSDIVELREDALDLEVVAINAIITARRAGDACRGYAFIASELQSIATSVAEGTTKLFDLGASTVTSLDRYHGSVDEIARFQTGFFDEFEHKLQNGFERLGCTLTDLLKMLSNLVHEAQSAEKPIVGIMSQIQMQDIITQSLAHVRLVIEHATQDGTVITEDGSHASMSQLCVSVLTDTRDKLGTALTRVNSDLSILRATLDRVGNVNHNATGPADFVGDLRVSFDTAIGLLGQVVEGITTVLKNQELLRDGGSSLSAEVSDILARLSGLSGLLTKLYPIQVMSRIQVAKTADLSNHQYSIDGISKFVSRAQTHVGLSEGDLAGGLSRLEKLIRGYSAEIEATTGVSRTIAGEIEDSINTLQQVRERMLSEIQRFNVFSDGFVMLLESAESNIRGLAYVDSLIADLITEITTSANSREGTVDLDKSAAAHFIESLLNQFTIARHKKSAASMAGMDIDTGDKEGELTLF